MREKLNQWFKSARVKELETWNEYMHVELCRLRRIVFFKCSDLMDAEGELKVALARPEASEGTNNVTALKAELNTANETIEEFIEAQDYDAKKYIALHDKYDDLYMAKEIKVVERGEYGEYSLPLRNEITLLKCCNREQSEQNTLLFERNKELLKERDKASERAGNQTAAFEVLETAYKEALRREKHYADEVDTKDVELYEVHKQLNQATERAKELKGRIAHLRDRAKGQMAGGNEGLLEYNKGRFVAFDDLFDFIQATEDESDC